MLAALRVTRNVSPAPGLIRFSHPESISACRRSQPRHSSVVVVMAGALSLLPWCGLSFGV
jgi:hypothetical protein